MKQGRIKLRVMGLSYSQLQSGAYALILAQVDGPIRIPVVIGASEAQSIAIRMENIKPPRPLTHDLFVSFAHGFGVKLLEVFIYKFEDGIFSSELTFSDGDRTIVIDSRTSDAIAIAMRTQAPIYTTKEILEETGFVLDNGENADDQSEIEGDEEEEYYDEDDDESEDEELKGGISLSTPKIENYTIEELERTLKKLIAQEKYEEAAEVNKILKAKKGNKE